MVTLSVQGAIATKAKYIVKDWAWTYYIQHITDPTLLYSAKNQGNIKRTIIKST